MNIKNTQPGYEEVPLSAYSDAFAPVDTTTGEAPIVGFAPIAVGIEKTKIRVELVRELGPDALMERTGLESLDAVVADHLEPGRLVVIGARPGVGKSTLAAQMALGIAAKGGKIAFWSGEMTSEGIVQRLAAQVGRLNLSRLRRGFTDTELHGRDEMGDLGNAFEILQDMGFFIDETPGLTIAEIEANTKMLQSKHPDLRMLVIDHLGLVRPDNARGSRTNQIGAITRAAKEMAKRLGIIVLLPSQLNRDSVKHGQEREPWISDLRDSGDIEQDADVVLFIHNDLETLSEVNLHRLKEQPGGEVLAFGTSDDLAVIYTAKVRDGALGMCLVKWVPQQVRFADMKSKVWAEYERPAPFTQAENKARRTMQDLLNLGS